MARISGIDIPNNKRVVISLTYIYGINHSTAKKILTTLKISEDKRVQDLNDDELTKIRREVSQLTIEGDLRRETAFNIKRLMEIGNSGTYRGLRHRRNLPVRGQSSKQNARTRKRANGPRTTVANKKK